MTLQRIGRSAPGQKIWAAGEAYQASRAILNEPELVRPQRPSYRIVSAVPFGPLLWAYETNVCQRIVREVALETGISVKDILSSKRKQEICWARHEAMYRCATETTRSLPQIARVFGKADHTTVGHAICRFAVRFNRPMPRGMKAGSYIHGTRKWWR